jgi:hypothetical protein
MKIAERLPVAVKQPARHFVKKKLPPADAGDPRQNPNREN